MSGSSLLAREMAFTRAYAEAETAHPYVRELACLRAQLPAMLATIEPGDWFAGRNDRLLVGVDPERGGLTNVAYYCNDEELRRLRDDPATPTATCADAAYLLDFWAARDYCRRCRAAFPASAQAALPSDDYYSAREIAYPMYGFGGPSLDYAKLTRLGISGLRAEVQTAAATATDTPESQAFFAGLHGALDLFTNCAEWYTAQAVHLATQAQTSEERTRATWVAANLRQITEAPPRHYAEAIQLLWLYSMLALPRNYGRLDVTLGSFLARDLASGHLTWEEARDITAGLWHMIAIRGDIFNNRIIVGGAGRPNTADADQFVRLALEVQEAVGGPIPQLSLRWDRTMTPEIWERALAVIAHGSTFPMLYNDEVNVPAVESAFGVPHEEAEQYVPYGCGELVLEGMSTGSPDAALNVAKALEATLNNGLDMRTGARIGLAQGTLADYPTFADLQAAFTAQLVDQIVALADVQAAITRVTGEACAFPFLSLLYADCVQRGKPLLRGGARYLGGTLESFGNTTAADSLYALKRLVYDEASITPARLLAALQADFASCEAELALMRRVPKYGNDDAGADAMALWLNTTVCELTAAQAARTGLDSFLVVLVNNGDHVSFGHGVAATPDGRHAGAPLSNGNQPTAGNDHTGLTALLHSMAKLPSALHAGATHNVKISRNTLTHHRDTVSNLLRGYFAAGGAQLMITVTDRAELEDALRHPEQHGNLLVRVGGYSARFIHLPHDLQLDILERTVY